MTIGMPTKAGRVLNLNTGYHIPCPHLPQHRFEGHGPQSCGENLASLPKCEALGEKKRLGFLSSLRILLSQLHVFALILQVFVCMSMQIMKATLKRRRYGVSGACWNGNTENLYVSRFGFSLISRAASQ